MMLAIDLNPVGDVIGGVSDGLGNAAGAAGEEVLEAVARSVFELIANAVTSIISSTATAMSATTSVDLDGGFFPALTPIRRTVLGMSMALVLALFFVAILRSLAAGEPGAIVRAAVVDVPAALFMTATSVSVTWVLIRVVDQASLAVTGDVPTAMGRFSAALSSVDALSTGGLLGIIFGLLFVVGAILVWLQLLVRSAMLYILVVLAPLGFATRAHPSTRPIARRTIEMGIALILSKFAVAVAFGVGAAAIDSSNGVPAGEGVDLTGMMTGVALMLMAAFMPWVIWKAIPVVEAAAVTAGVERSPGRAATTAASLGVAVEVGAARLAGGGAGAGGTGGAGDGAGVASVDGMPSAPGAAASVAAAGAAPGSGRSSAPPSAQRG
ncbi:MAG: hypothetical protein R2755_26155 [Acidimicrobiales bacterium]